EKLKYKSLLIEKQKKTLQITNSNENRKFLEMHEETHQTQTKKNAMITPTIIYQTIYIHYNNNGQQLQKELSELEQKSQALDSTTVEPSVNQQNLKKTMLALAAKQIFAKTRKETIKSLIITYQKISKSDKKFDKLDKIGGYIGDAGEFASIFPGGSIPIKLIGKGISLIANIFKSYFHIKHSQNFKDYLLKDSKINPTIIEMLKLDDQNQFDKYDVFEVGDIHKNAKLKSEDMQKAIELLTDNFDGFIQELRQETEECTEKIEFLFSESEGELLQKEVTKLLNKLADQIKESEPNINKQEIIHSVKHKLESKSFFPCVKQRREKKLVLLFKNIPITQEELVKNLENIKPGLSEKLNTKEIDMLIIN
ncbi:10995_t:CDS:2, partial [Racocetra persica]